MNDETPRQAPNNLPGLPKGQNLHALCKEDYESGRRQWRETTQEFYDDSLEVLPPLCFDGTNFLVSEPYTYTATNEAVDTAVRKHGDGRIFTMLSTVAEFRKKTYPLPQ